MSWKGLISRMSDECLMTLETVFSYCYDCQAVMRKFTLAGKTMMAWGCCCKQLIIHMWLTSLHKICQKTGFCHFIVMK